MLQYKLVSQHKTDHSAVVTRPVWTACLLGNSSPPPGDRPVWTACLLGNSSPPPGRLHSDAVLEEKLICRREFVLGGAIIHLLASEVFYSTIQQYILILFNASFSQRFNSRTTLLWVCLLSCPRALVVVQTSLLPSEETTRDGWVLRWTLRDSRTNKHDRTKSGKTLRFVKWVHIEAWIDFSILPAFSLEHDCYKIIILFQGFLNNVFSRWELPPLLSLWNSGQKRQYKDESNYQSINQYPLCNQVKIYFPRMTRPRRQHYDKTSTSNSPVQFS